MKYTHVLCKVILLSMGIGRLPRFNPEKLNVVALDHRLAELVDHCRVLQGQVDSCRTLAMRCADRLDVYDTVLQQHSNVLREIKDDIPAYHPTSSKTVRNVDSRVDRKVDRIVNSNVDRQIDSKVDRKIDRNVDSNVDKKKREILTEMLRVKPKRLKNKQWNVQH